MRIRKKGVTVSEKENKELIKKGYAAFSSGDVETVMDLFDDDIEWVQPGKSLISGTYCGKAEVMELFGELAEKRLTVKVNGIVAEGDTVVALTEVSVGGETGQNADVFTVRDGKTVRAQVHGDTAMLERVFGTRELGADLGRARPVGSWTCGFLA